MYYTTRIPIYQIFDVNQEIDHAINLNTLLKSYLLIEIQFSTMEKRQQKMLYSQQNGKKTKMIELFVGYQIFQNRQRLTTLFQETSLVQPFTTLT